MEKEKREKKVVGEFVLVVSFFFKFCPLPSSLSRSLSLTLPKRVQQLGLHRVDLPSDHQAM